MTYTSPKITEMGSVRELTLGLNKVGGSPDMYSNTVPIIGSIVPQR